MLRVLRCSLHGRKRCLLVRPIFTAPWPSRRYATAIQQSELDEVQPGPRRRRAASIAQQPDLIITRPTVKSFSREGIGKEIAKHLQDFPHALLLCRIGQFYESYFDQAVEIADLLKIKLTSKSFEQKKYPMCGFPVGQLDKFLEKLVREHNRFVAICDEHKHYDTEGNFKFITRKVVRVVTPGTLIDESFIEKQQHNFLLAIDLPDPKGDSVELAWIDTSTGELYILGTSITSRSFTEDIARVAPSEVVLPEYFSKPEYRSHPVAQLVADLEGNPRVSYPTKDLSLLDPNDKSAAEIASAIPLLSSYIRQTLLEQSPDLSHPLRVRPNTDMRIDRVSLKALEIRQNNDGGRSGTLLSVLDRTVTSAGMRLLSDRITAPSKVLPEIQARLALVSWFKANPFVRDDVVARLHQLDDEARLLQKMSIGRPTAEDLLSMARAIRVQAEIKAVLSSALKAAKKSDQATGAEDAAVVKRYVVELRLHNELAEAIESSVDINALEAQRIRDYAAEAAAAVDAAAELSEEVQEDEEEPLDIWDTAFGRPSKIAKKKGTTSKSKGTIVKRKELSETTADGPTASNKQASRPVLEPVTWGKPEPTVMQPDSSDVMSRIYDNIDRVEKSAHRLYNELRRQTQAPVNELLLRVVPRFGPVLRIGWKKTHSPAMREALKHLEDEGVITMVRKHSSARYFAHPRWTKYNSEMQGLLVQLKEAESIAVRKLCNDVLVHWDALRRNAAITAELDVATSSAKAAEELKLIRPEVNDSNSLEIIGGRHPVAEFELSKQGVPFTSNDTVLDEKQQLHVITGPNMGGKSTVLRQVGIIAAMAQAGCFVPAQSAKIGIVDQLFARIRYSDNIARGRSSFRVEMDDAAYILGNATERSLVLLDEFGRGTTADYAACIAEATIYALSQEIKARSLFATHLHDIYDIIHEDEARSDLRKNVVFFCTHLEEKSSGSGDDEASLKYLYRLSPGVNRNAEAFKVARVAGYPEHLLHRAQAVYSHSQRNLQV